MIKWVFFDLAGVLFVEDWVQIVKVLSRNMGVPLDRVGEAYYRDLKDRVRRWNQGRISALEFWKPVFRLRQEASLLTKKKWAQEVANTFVPIPTSVRILRRLKGKVRLGIISNQPWIGIRHMNRHKSIMKLFELKIISCQVGLIKRFGNPRIFKLALKRAKAKPGECVYIDDRATHVETAQSLGMKGIVFQSPQHLKKELRALGVKF